MAGQSPSTSGPSEFLPFHVQADVFRVYPEALPLLE